MISRSLQRGRTHAQFVSPTARTKSTARLLRSWNCQKEQTQAPVERGRSSTKHGLRQIAGGRHSKARYLPPPPPPPPLRSSFTVARAQFAGMASSQISYTSV